MKRRPPATACRVCLEPARRWVDERGRPQTNLDPTTGLCVTCLSSVWNRVTALGEQQIVMPFDPRAAAARNDD